MILILVLAAVTLGLGITTSMLPRMWRGDWHYAHLDPDHVPAAWVWGKPLWQGWLRLALVGVVIGWLGVLGVTFLKLAGDSETGLLYTAAAICALASIPFIVLMATVVFFNRPKFMVVPSMRHQRGAVAQWLSRGQ